MFIEGEGWRLMIIEKEGLRLMFIEGEGLRSMFIEGEGGGEGGTMNENNAKLLTNEFDSEMFITSKS